jgi:hypothetical protein|nr:MAG TPA: hypothetical protein [Caudoviricetes sp.]
MEENEKLNKIIVKLSLEIASKNLENTELVVEKETLEERVSQLQSELDVYKAAEQIKINELTPNDNKGE